MRRLIGGVCAESEGASICGPQCAGYGPGWASGRCPASSVWEQTICPSDHINPAPCLIMCGEASHCPDPGMVCVTCPEPYLDRCEALWRFASEKGPNICAWPGL